MPSRLFACLVAFLALFPLGRVEAVLVVQDDFAAYTPGAVIGGPDWNPKWVAGTQQSLFRASASGGYAVLDTSVAERSYHITNQTGFEVQGSHSTFVRADFQYSHLAGGNITTSLNENAFGLLLSDQPQWWNGTNKNFSLANRGGALGNRLPTTPFVQGWMPHGNFGVNTTDGGLSEWFNVEWELYESGGTIWGAATVTDDQGPNTATHTSTPIDLGFAAGTTLYAGLSTDWNSVSPQGSISSFSSIDAVNIDNFSIESIPEPSAVLFGTLLSTGIGLTVERRRKRD